ncbi:hypothetical protein PpBr36_02063 [Pyricularia pennisetigena]|uniref:hypothetical protein n=1 Tax=Pyricularia pennisetigena TaxID=1578925 RepID=UPI0011521514|nr:hypothetical protein PpBr36_02063 [Pyricularia pennisetigena]TLS27891.1 hypothetical protein PpBr36_02063 [Pyricularia pennisetigena]
MLTSKFIQILLASSCMALSASNNVGAVAIVSETFLPDRTSSLAARREPDNAGCQSPDRSDDDDDNDDYQYVIYDHDDPSTWHPIEDVD